MNAAMNVPVVLPSTMHFIERDWLSANAIMFDDGDAWSVVDTGYKTHEALTVALVSHVMCRPGGTPASLARIVNTHLHSDHCGGNARLQALYPAVHTWVPGPCLEIVNRWDEQRLSFGPTGQQCDRFEAQHGLGPGDRLTLGGLQWEVIAAPGHDHTMFALYQAEYQIALTADALWENGFGVIFPELEGESGFVEQAATLDALAQRPIKVVIPGHGRLFTDAQRAIDTARSRLEYLRADPQRNALQAARVLLKFLLLERQQIALATLPQALEGIGLFKRMNARWFQLPAAQLAEQLASALVRAKAAELRGPYLLNRG